MIWKWFTEKYKMCRKLYEIVITFGKFLFADNFCSFHLTHSLNNFLVQIYFSSFSSALSSALGEVHSPFVVDVVFISPDEGSGMTIIGAQWWALAIAAVPVIALAIAEQVGRAKRRTPDVELLCCVFDPGTWRTFL